MTDLTKKGASLSRLDSYIRENETNEDYMALWFMLVPDDADADDFNEMAEDDYIYNRCHELFGSIVAR